MRALHVATLTPVKPVATVVTLALFVVACASAGAQDRGQRLFAGAIALPGTITGHTAPLRPDAARCINCHTTDATAKSTSASLGPPLTAAWLTTAVSRRRGPPSRYDAASFCSLLRTGVDPAFIVAAQTMPRYALSDADCADLWRHVTRPASAAPDASSPSSPSSSSSSRSQSARPSTTSKEAS